MDKPTRPEQGGVPDWAETHEELADCYLRLYENWSNYAEALERYIVMLETEITTLEAQLAEAEQKLRHRETYLETVIEAFMIQYCPDGEGVSEVSMGEAYAARGVTCSDELYASVDAAHEASEKEGGA